MCSQLSAFSSCWHGPFLLRGSLPRRVDQDLTPAQGQALVDRALANELRAAQDASHPMRYQLRKTSPRLTTTKEICETRDGDVARLIAINDRPLSAADEQKEEARLDALLSDPGKQRHRKQAEDTDAGRALKVLRALPTAFDYQYAGSGRRHRPERWRNSPSGPSPISRRPIWRPRF